MSAKTGINMDLSKREETKKTIEKAQEKQTQLDQEERDFLNLLKTRQKIDGFQADSKKQEFEKMQSSLLIDE